MANKIQLRRDTAANWLAVNPVLGDGEPGLDIDSNRIKVGDGSTPWNALGWSGTGTGRNPTSIAMGGGYFDGQGTSQVAGSINQGGRAIAIGESTAVTDQGGGAIALGDTAGNYQQGFDAVAIGETAGEISQGAYAVAIGFAAGDNNQPANSIIINAWGSSLNGTNVGLYIDPIRNDVTSTSIGLFYDATTKEITYNTVITPVPNALINGTHSVTLDSDGALTGDGANGNFYIDTITSTGTTSTWVFGVSGTTTLPGLLSAPPNTISTSTATGTVGQMCWDANYIYVCTATNAWRRIGLGW